MVQKKLCVTWLGTLMVLAIVGCKPRSESMNNAGEVRATGPEVVQQDHMDFEHFVPRVPNEDGPNAPTLLRFGDPEVAAAHDWTGEAAACGACHEQQAAEWRESAHHYASFQNPWYRAVVDRFREGIGEEASLFCAGCHDPALVATGAMRSEITAETEHAFAGVTCVMCHRATGAEPEGNAALLVDIGHELEIANRDVPQHINRMQSPTFDGATSCMSCHRGILSPDTGNHHALAGMDDATGWQRSAWAGNGLGRIDRVEPTSCIGCHMPEESHGARSHRFPGAQTALADGAGLAEQMNELEAFLKDDVARVTIVALRTGAKELIEVRGLQAAPYVEGEPADDPVFVDVLVENIGAGHSFPGGTLDLQGTWLEFVLVDQSGATAAALGSPETLDAPGVFEIRAEPIDERGTPMALHETEHFRTAAWNHTIAPRGATVVRFQIPEAVSAVVLSGHLRARLIHKRHPDAFYEWSCDQSRSERARAFDDAFAEAGNSPVDACAGQPEIVMSTDMWSPGEHTVEGETQEAPGDTVRLLWKYAEGMAGALQEELGEALALIDLQRERLTLNERQSARLRLTEAAIMGRMGRTDEALAMIDEVEAVVDVPSLNYQRYLALERVWRWDEAAAVASSIVEELPFAELGWIALSRALASSGNDAAALSAAHAGLQIQPRSPELLRTQYTTLRRLIAEGDPRIETAQEAYASFRPDDESRSIQARCYRDETCAAERRPLEPRELVIVR